MDIISLKYYISLAENRSFTKAANKSFVTQPTLSRQIADLEEEFGVPLIIRGKRNISLTEAGSILLEEAEEIVRRYDGLYDRVRQGRGKLIGTLRIGYLGNQERDLLSMPFRSFSVKHPKVNMILEKSSLGDLNQHLRDGKLDIIYTVLPGLDNLKGISYLKIADDRLFLAVPETHPLANQKSVKVPQLADEKFVFLNRDASPLTVDELTEMCLKNGFSPHILTYTKDIGTALLYVSAERGCAFVTLRSTKDLPNVRYLEIENCALDYSIVLAYRSDNSNPMLQFYFDEIKAMNDTAD